MRYPEAGGLPALREAIAGHLRMNRGIACAAEEVFVFHGAQDAFSRIAALLVDPGDPVWFENPGHIGARNALVAAGARLVPVPVDDDGLDVAAGLAAAPDVPPRLRHAVAPAAARRRDEPRAPPGAARRRRARRRLDRRGRRGRRALLRRPAAAGAPQPRRCRPGDPRRLVQQVAVPGAAPRLRAGAAGPRRGLRAGRRRHPAGRPDAAAGDARRLHRRRPLRRPHPPDAQALRRAPRRAPRRRRPPPRRPLRGPPHPLRPRHRRPPARRRRRGGDRRRRRRPRRHRRPDLPLLPRPGPRPRPRPRLRRRPAARRSPPASTRSPPRCARPARAAAARPAVSYWHANLESSRFPPTAGKQAKKQCAHCALLMAARRPAAEGRASAAPITPPAHPPAPAPPPAPRP